MGTTGKAVEGGAVAVSDALRARLAVAVAADLLAGLCRGGAALGDISEAALRVSIAVGQLAAAAHAVAALP